MFNYSAFIKSTALAAFMLSGVLSYSIGNADELPPLIFHDPPTNALVGEDFRLEATVRDDDGIEGVILNFKLPSASDFNTRAMTEAGKDLFQAELSGSELTEQGLDYYIEATDGDGNVESRGFDFDPLRLNVGTAPVVAQGSDGFSVEPKSGGINWLYVAGGVLAAGALAAALGSGGGGDSGETTAGLTFVDP